MSGNPPPGSYEANALKEQAKAQDYQKIADEYNRLTSAGVGGTEAERMHQAVVDLYGNDAQRIEQEIAKDADRFRAASVGERLFAAKDALLTANSNKPGKRKPIPIPGGEGGALTNSTATKDIVNTRNAMRHPEAPYTPLAPEEYQENAIELQSKTLWAKRKLEDMLKGGTWEKDQKAAIQTAIDNLDGAQSSLNDLKAGITSASKLSLDDLELARKAREVDASGWAAATRNKTTGVIAEDMKAIADNGRDIIHGERGSSQSSGSDASRGGMGGDDEQGPALKRNNRFGATGKGGLVQTRNPLNDQSNHEEGGNPSARDPRYDQAPVRASTLPTKEEVVPSATGGSVNSEATTRTKTPILEHPAVTGALTTGIHGFLTYNGIMETAEGIKELQNGQTGAGVTKVALGGTSTVFNGLLMMKSANPRLLGETAGDLVFENLERANLAVMAAQGIVEIVTAPDNKKGEVAFRMGSSAVTATASGAMIEGLGLGGGAIATLGPFAAAAASGLLLKRAFDMDHMEGVHINTMNEIAPDGSHSHLKAELAKLKNTMKVAAYGDNGDESGKFVKDSGGRLIDVNNQANLDKIEKGLTPEQRKSMQAIIDGQADQMFEARRTAPSTADIGFDETMTAKDIQDYKNNLKPDLERQYLQGMLAKINEAIETRDAIVPKDAKLALDANGDIALDNEKNRELLGVILNKEYDLATKATANSEQMFYYLNLVNGQKKLGVHNALEEAQKTTAVAISELNGIQWGADPNSHLDISQAETNKNIRNLRDQAAAMAKANGGQQNIRTDFFYVATNNNSKTGEVNDVVTTDDRNEKLPASIMKQYQDMYDDDHTHFKKMEIDQVIYKTDANGNKVPDKLVVWHIMDQNALQEDDKAHGRPKLDYVKDVSYQMDGSGQVTLTAKTSDGNAATGSTTKDGNKKSELTDRQIDAQLIEQLKPLEEQGLGKLLGSDDVREQLKRIKEACATNGTQLSDLDKNHDGHLTMQEISDALRNQSYMASNQAREDAGRGK